MLTQTWYHIVEISQKIHNNLPLRLEITRGGGSLLGRSRRKLLTRNRKEKKTGKNTDAAEERKMMPEAGTSDWLERWSGHQSLEVGGWVGGGVTCQVMHQIFYKMSHYGVSCYNNHYQADQDVDDIARQIYSVPGWRNVVHKVGPLVFLLFSPEQLEEPPVLDRQMCGVQE